jgi:hypothetical protein
MGDEVVQFPQEPIPEFLIGPFTQYRIVINGRVIPGLTGREDGADVWLTVDDRFSAKFRKADAYQAARLIAEALAIGSGYTNFGAETKDRPFAPIATRIDS